MFEEPTYMHIRTGGQQGMQPGQSEQNHGAVEAEEALVNQLIV